VSAPPPTLVLLPGLEGTGTLFEPLVAAMADTGFPTHIVRYPCHQMLDFAALVAIARQALPAEGPYVLLGESFSGPIAIALAASKPQGLCGLVLCCTFARNPRPSLAPLRRWIDWLPIKQAPMWTLDMLVDLLVMGRNTKPPVREALHHAIAQVDDAVLKTRLRTVVDMDVSDQLATVQIPVLYLQALQDRLISTASAEHICTVLPHVQVRQLAGPHGLLQAAPQESAQIIARFMQSLRAAQAPPR
jgi:pimeloyl-ACP methyl ester carboxylesterase